MKSSILVTCPWGSACSCHVAPFTFDRPLGSPVLNLHVHVPFPVPRRLPAKGPVCSEKKNSHRGEPPWGSARSSREAPIHFRPQFTTRFRVSPRARAGPRAAAVEDKGVGLPGELVNAQYTFVLLQDSRHIAHGAISLPTSSLTYQVPPTSSCCTRGQSE
jgi:hypothetical protein